ncbi:Sel1 repeat protein [Pelomyxa schiedti]|nr:Sel1 repeat protein [Pelomyxa schiedti]
MMQEALARHGLEALTSFGAGDYVSELHCLFLLMGGGSPDEFDINTIGLNNNNTSGSYANSLPASKSGRSDASDNATVTNAATKCCCEVGVMEEEPLPGKALGLVLLRYTYSNNPEMFSHQRPHSEYMLDALLERAKKCSGVCHRFMNEVLDRACDVKVVDVDVDGGKSRALFCAGHFIKGSLLFRGLGIEEDFKGCVAHMRACEPYQFALALNTIGLCYEKGKGVEKDVGKSFQFYMMAAVKGVLIAQGNVAMCFWNGTGVEMDKKEAFSWFKRSSALPVSCSKLSHCYRIGEGVDKDPQESLRLLKFAAEQGVANAQYKLAQQTSDPAAAWKLLMLAAAQGYSNAQCEVGKALLKGKGVDKNTAEASRYLRMAAAQGNHFALARLAAMYQYGDGVPLDNFEAFRLFSQSAELGNRAAQSEVGRCYYTGRGVNKDYSLAVHWFRKGLANPRKGGYGMAHNSLARCFRDGHGVARDTAEAFRLYSMAALHGNLISQFNVGVCLENHVGTPAKDTREAMRWYRLAASRGNTPSVRRLESIITKSTRRAQQPQDDTM